MPHKSVKDSFPEQFAQHEHLTSKTNTQKKRTLFEINLNIFFGSLFKAKEIKAKINKQDLSKLKCYCTAKETLNDMVRQPKEWENIFTNDMTDKRLIS